ncbi:MAG TPA: hypothetical protein VNN22_18250 [Verrucomicrobiae bacterium]|nr:hypothetical protein [Verrucomicrobiae bacterium]
MLATDYWAGEFIGRPVILCFTPQDARENPVEPILAGRIIVAAPMVIGGAVGAASTAAIGIPGGS